MFDAAGFGKIFQSARDDALTPALAYVVTGSPGVFVDLADTLRGFQGLCEGKYDHLPEAAFYMVGTIEQAVEKGKRLAAEAA